MVITEKTAQLECILIWIFLCVFVTVRTSVCGFILGDAYVAMATIKIRQFNNLNDEQDQISIHAYPNKHT